MPFHQFFQQFMHDLPRLADSGPYVYIAVFAASLIESIPVVGTFTPGTLLLLFFGFVVSNSHVSLWGIIFFAAIGGVVGDFIAYLIGRFGLRFLSSHRKILEHSHTKWGQAFFNRHGGKSVMFARFIGPIRPIVPMIAGMLDMRVKDFLAWNVCGSFLWAGIYISLGYFFGDKWRPIGHALGRASSAAFIIIVFICLLYALKKFSGKKGYGEGKISKDAEDANMLESKEIDDL